MRRSARMSRGWSIYDLTCHNRQAAARQIFRDQVLRLYEGQWKFLALDIYGPTDMKLIND